MPESYELHEGCVDIGKYIGENMVRDLKAGKDPCLIAHKYNVEFGQVRANFEKNFPDGVNRFNRLGDVNIGVNSSLSANGCNLIKIARY